MPTVINTNLASLFAQNSLSNAQNNLAQSVQRLSSGLRINSAKDDAAGLSISQNMQSQINGTNQSIRNLSDATNLLQTADSSLSTVQDMILRLKQLATQGYDGSLSISQKLNIVQEMKDLNNEINATAARTNFNGINLLSSGSSVDLNNSDLKAGMALTTTAPAVTVSSGTGLYATGGANAATGLNDVSTGLLLGVGNVGTTATTYSIVLDSEKAPKLNGNFTLSSNGNALTLTGTLNGLAASQTVSVQDAASNATGGTAKTTTQSLNFDNFGITLNLSSTRAAADTLTGSAIATKLATAAYNTLNITGTNGAVTDVRLSGVAPGTYTMVYNETGGIGSLGLPSNAASVLVTPGGDGTLRGVALTGGSGTGAFADIAYNTTTGAVTGVTMRVAGTGYKAGDKLGFATSGAISVAGGAQGGAASTVAIAAHGTDANGATVTETSTVTFGGAGATDNALTAGQSLTIGGLTFTATATVSRKELLRAFMNLSDGATGINSASLSEGAGAAQVLAATVSAKGYYSGTLSGFETTTNDRADITTAATLVFRSTNLNNNVADLTLTQNARSAIAIAGTNIVVGKDLSSLSGTNKTLTMSGTINGLATTQSLAVSTNAALATQTFNFSSFGVQFDVKSYQEQSASQIGTALATLNGLGGTASFGSPGELIVSQGNNSALKFQSGANSDAFIQIDTLNIQTGTSGSYAGTASQMTTLGDRIAKSGTGNLASLGLTDTIDTWQTAFKNAAAAVDNALEYISTQRATFGSQMNRLSYVSSNLQAQSTNLQNSRSAIVDTDFAAETAKLTKGQIMQQAATAMLAQANQMPNVILSLLK
jgi:flagellin